MNAKIFIGSMLLGACASNAMALEVEEFSGTYELSCESANLTFNLAHGVGDTAQTDSAILANVDGQTFSHSVALTCTEDAITAPETLRADILQYCEDNLVIPQDWSLSCKTITDESAKWAEQLAVKLSKGLIQEATLSIGSSRNWFENWLGIHPTDLELVREEDKVSSKSTTVYNSGKFKIGSGIRYPLVGGLNGFSCVGGIVDNANGQLTELADSAHELAADESNIAGIICTKEQNEQQLVLAVSIGVETTYRGGKAQY